MRRSGFLHPITAMRHVTRQRIEGADEAGFTLIELVVVVAVLPVIVGGLVAGLLSVMNLSPSISNTLSDSGDAQVLSTSFDKDVQSAQMITGAATPSNPAACGLGTQVLGLQYGGGTEVSYSLVTLGTGATSYQNLLRNAGQVNGTSCSLTSSVVLAHHVVNTSGTGNPTATVSCAAPPPPPAPPPPACVGSPPAWQTAWVAVAGIDSVTLPVLYTSTSYKQNLIALPSGGGNPGATPSVTAPTYGCGFALPGTGTYASTLCFMDFTPWNTGAGTPCAGGGLQISEGITNTPFTMSFCLQVTGGPVGATAIPTYTGSPTDGFGPTSAFLGNNGFYTGIPNNPGLFQDYQSTGGDTAIINITNIQVLGPGGVPATNWSLVTGNAGATNDGDSITWNAGWSAGSPVPAKQQVFSLIDNSPTSAIGNDCANPTPGSGLNTGNGLTGVGTATVACQNSVDSDKTGTVMISAPGPSSINTTLVRDSNGADDLEAIFIGILLPG